MEHLGGRKRVKGEIGNALGLFHRVISGKGGAETRQDEFTSGSWGNKLSLAPTKVKMQKEKAMSLLYPMLCQCKQPR